MDRCERTELHTDLCLIWTSDTQQDRKSVTENQSVTTLRTAYLNEGWADTPKNQALTEGADKETERKCLFLFLFLFSINVVISSLIEYTPVESPFLPPFPQIVCVCVGGGGVGGRAGGCASACHASVCE